MSNEDLARRTIACKGWRWMSGMLTDVGERVTDPGICYLGTLPDLTDPPTLGGLLALVREAWRPHKAHTPSTAHTFRGWGVLCRGEPLTDMTHNTEAEALVAALEAASCQ